MQIKAKQMDQINYLSFVRVPLSGCRNLKNESVIIIKQED